MNSYGKKITLANRDMIHYKHYIYNELNDYWFDMYVTLVVLTANLDLQFVLRNLVGLN